VRGRGESGGHGDGLPLLASSKRSHPAKKRGVCHDRKVRTCIGATERRRLVRRRFLMEDRHICRTHSPAVAGRRVADVLRGALGHLRQSVRLVRAGKWRVVGEGPVAMGTSPSREKSGNLTDVGTVDYQKATGAGAVKRKRGLGGDCIQATVAANGGCAGDGSIPDTLGMAVDQEDQLLPAQWCGVSMRRLSSFLLPTSYSGFLLKSARSHHNADIGELAKIGRQSDNDSMAPHIGPGIGNRHVPTLHI